MRAIFSATCKGSSKATMRRSKRASFAYITLLASCLFRFQAAVAVDVNLAGRQGWSSSARGARGSWPTAYGIDNAGVQTGRVRGRSRNSVSSSQSSSILVRILQPPMGMCGGPGMGTCPPTRSPTFSPSAQPSASPAPTQSSMPSASPTTSMEPSASPSVHPSASPSDQPSGVPTITPRPSGTPSASPTETPSAAPSKAPSAQPTPIPTFSPTATPSASPSNSPRPSISPPPTLTAYPTVDPDGYATDVFVGPDRLPQANSTCRPPIPSSAESVDDQLVAFGYVANVKKGSNITLVVSSIALRLQDELSQQYLSCDFAPGQEFYTHAVSSLPGDAVNASASCSSSQDADNSECYIVDGTFTATIFYLSQDSSRRTRYLQSSGGNATAPAEASTSTAITDPNVYQSFSTALNNIFASGALQGNRVTSLSYQGISNSNVPTPAPRATNAAAIAGGSIGGFLALCLIVLLVVLGVTAYRKKHRYPEQVGEGDFQDTRDLEEVEDGHDASVMRPYEDDPSATEDQPFARIPITSSPDTNDEDEDTLFSRSQADNNNNRVRVVVFNEDDTLVSAAPPQVGLYDGNDASKEPQLPRFFNMRDLRQQDQPGMGLPSPSSYNQQSNPARRAYDISDTVDL